MDYNDYLLTFKLFILITNAFFSEFTFGNALEDQQLGCLWQQDYLLTVSLSGQINYLDINNPSCPKRIVKVSELAYIKKIAEQKHKLQKFLQNSFVLF